MAMDISLIRNIDYSFKDKNGEVFDVVAICENENKQGVICIKVPQVYDNDYEFLHSLKNTFLTLEKEPHIASHCPKLNDDFELNDAEAELLKSSHAVCDFANDALFAFNGNMLRFSLGKDVNSIYFVRNQKPITSFLMRGSIISALPDIFMQFNISKIKKDIKFYKNLLKSNTKSKVVQEKEEKLDRYESVFDRRMQCTIHPTGYLS